MDIKTNKKKIKFWTFHIIIWLLTNVFLGSLPFIRTFFTNGQDNPLHIGVLCFCFTVVSGGLYTSLIDSQKGDHDGVEQLTFCTKIILAFAWVVVVWSIVLMLGDVITTIDNNFIFSCLLWAIYLISVALFFYLNLNSISHTINTQLQKKKMDNSFSSSIATSKSMTSQMQAEDTL